MRVTNEIGKKDFQVKAMSRSYRIRGKLARIHKKVNARAIVLTPKIPAPIKGIDIVPVKKTDVSSLIIKIFMYSDIKINAKGPPPYSILKPDTNSDSPSLKSKGVRFVSANAVINHMKKEGAMINTSQYILLILIHAILKELIIIKIPMRIKAILTS